ncbi:MAG: penicillin-binding protein activator [Gammaproteobacteria bacterium]|nr:penicillin-binding protein activator [Gammaproteobacteria bacterium]
MVSTQRFLAIPILAMALVVTACAPTLPREQARAQAQELAQQARSLAAQGDYAGAAARYREAAARADEGPAHLLRLRAVGMLLDAGAPTEAAKLLASLPEKADDGQARGHRAVARATLAAEDGRPGDALALLESVTVPEDGPLQRRWLALRARLLEDRQDHLAAARDRSRLDTYLEGEQAAANRAALWAALERLDVAALEAAPANGDARFEGWTALAALARRYATNGGALMTALGTWSARFPDHPAEVTYLPRLRETALTLGTRPDHIAVLLPEHGGFARAGAAVRDGLVAAWLQDTPDARPRLSFLDESTAAPWDGYGAAVDTGAEFIIGPLTKDALAALGRGDAMPLPTLALNHLETAADGEAPAPLPDQLFQFGLSPEAEAREVALRAWFDGHQQALVLAPDSPWGDRVATAFTREWADLGGVVAESGAYDSNPDAMSRAVAALVNVDASDQRARTLRGILARDLETEPRPRRDAHFVFLAATTDDARQLRPQLRFHRAGQLPVYSTSHVFSGTVDPTAARDLEDIRFADMPWMVRDDHPGAALQDAIERYWPDRARRYGRLFALGVDAYALATELPRLYDRPATRLEGVTGRLGLDGRRRVHRGLTWAQFHDGGIRLLDIPYEPR